MSFLVRVVGRKATCSVMLGAIVLEFWCAWFDKLEESFSRILLHTSCLQHPHHVVSEQSVWSSPVFYLSNIVMCMQYIK